MSVIKKIMYGFLLFRDLPLTEKCVMIYFFSTENLFIHARDVFLYQE